MKKYFTKFNLRHTHTQAFKEILSLLAALLLMSACVDGPGDLTPPEGNEDVIPETFLIQDNLPTDSESPEDLDPSQVPFIHPLQSWDPRRGKIFQEVRDDMDGKRFVAGDRIHSNENGTEVSSGIWTIDQERISDEELQKLVDQGLRNRARRASQSKIGPVLGQWLEQSDSSARETVIIYFHHPAGFVSMIYRMHDAIARGRIRTLADRENVRQELLQAEKTEIDSYLLSQARAIEAEGGLVQSFCESDFCMNIQTTPDVIRRLVEFPQVLRMDKGNGGTHENAPITGQTVSIGAQMEQFQNYNYLGDYNSATRGVIDVAVVEHGKLRKTHPGLKESSGTTSRVQKTMVCTLLNGCSTSNYTSDYSGHSIAVAGLAVGDLTDGQDPLYTTDYSRISRSGYGREANLFFYRAPADNDIPTNLNAIALDSAEILSMSISSFVNADPPIPEIDTDPNCDGRHANAIGVNNVFEHGILTFVATGNNGHISTTDCGVEDAANAIGAFAVSIYTPNFEGFTDPESVIRSGDLHTKSDRGGTWDSNGNILEGNGRTIIDLVAQGCRTMIFDELGGYAEEECATSYAAPTAAGAAVQLMDHYRNNITDLIYEPGSLAVNMLLMGDRETESGTKASSGFDSVWGAGRMKMRKWDTYGLDEPFEYFDSLACISDGTDYIFWINQGLDIGTDVDVIKGALYFYDRRHGMGNGANDFSIDNIDLRLQKYQYNPFLMRWSWNDVKTSASPTDEKERVYYEPNGGKYRFIIRGTDVTAEDEGCGVGSMMVYFAYYMEDSDRDDANGPDSTIDEEDMP